jgi:hypothetical protein
LIYWFYTVRLPAVISKPPATCIAIMTRTGKTFKSVGSYSVRTRPPLHHSSRQIKGSSLLFSRLLGKVSTQGFFSSRLYCFIFHPKQTSVETLLINYYQTPGFKAYAYARPSPSVIVALAFLLRPDCLVDKQICSCGLSTNWQDFLW